MILLIADDDRDLCDLLENFFSKLGHIVIKAYTAASALSVIRRSRVDIAFLDVQLPDKSGLDLAQSISRIKPRTRIVLISGRHDVITMINSLEMGIYDFLEKPFSIVQIAALLNKAERTVRPRKKRTSITRQFQLQQQLRIGKPLQIAAMKIPPQWYQRSPDTSAALVISRSMKMLFRKLAKLSGFHDIPVLIEGETGTGKEILAKYLHYAHCCDDRPFVPINCTTINKEIFEAELFGYEGGAFTGANPHGRQGKICMAQGGTLFLDEITEIPLECQAKLLRVLQEREFYRIGGKKQLTVDTRIVCATNRPLEIFVRRGLFRRDLFYRLSACRVRVPPLRERPQEIIPLLVHFIQELNARMTTKVDEVELSLVRLFHDYHWPGNIRELKNLLTNAVIMNQRPVLSLRDCEPFLEAREGTRNDENVPGSVHQLEGKPRPLDPDHFTLGEKAFDLENYTRAIVRKTLKKFHGNKTLAAKFLGLSRGQLYYRYRQESPDEI